MMTIIEEAIEKIEQGYTDKGLELLKSYEKKANDDELFTIATLYHQWGLINQAKDLFIQLNNKYPDESEIKLYLAEIYTDIGEDQEAIQLLNSIPEWDDYHVQALIESADLYQSQGLFEVAEQKLMKAKRFVPDEPIIDFALGELAYSNGEYQKAILYYERVRKHYSSLNEVDINARIAESLAATGKWEEALDYFQSMESVESPDLLFQYGLTAFRSDRRDISIHVWEELLNMDSEYISVYPLLAQAYEQEGLIKDAIRIAEKALTIDEWNKELHYLLGKLQLTTNKQEAIKHLQDAINIDPGYKEAVMDLIYIYKQEENYTSIKELLSYLQDSGETDPLFLWELARANYELEEYELALNNYKEAYNFFTSDAEFLKEYGYVLVEEGRYVEAKKIFEQYLQVEPFDQDVLEYLERL
jgi:tetratricopeptide (TPR) repeat protein